MLIPLSVLGSAGILAYVLISGTAMSPITVNTDGTVNAGIAMWKFPGQLTALASKTGHAQNWIDLRYGSAMIRLPGDVTEGLTIYLADQINRWSKDRIRGVADPFEPSKAKRTMHWGVYYWMFLVIVVVLGNGAGDYATYLNVNAPFGTWATVSILIFSGLMVMAASIRWGALVRTGVRRGRGIWVAEVAVVGLLILGGGAIVGRCAQVIETIAKSETLVTFDAPLRLTKTTQGKGCHRDFILDEPSLGRTILYCDPHSLEYWKGATGVRVTELRGQFGLRITSIGINTQP